MSDFNLSKEETRKAFVLAKSVALETLEQLQNTGPYLKSLICTMFSVQNFKQHFVFEYPIS